MGTNLPNPTCQDLDEEVTFVALLDTRHLNEQVRRKRLKFGMPSGKHTKNIKKLWKKHNFFMGKSTISMSMFNSYVRLPEGIYYFLVPLQ